MIGVRKKRTIITPDTPLKHIPEAFVREVLPKLVLHGPYEPCWPWVGETDRNGYPLARWTDPETGKRYKVWMRTFVAKMFWEYPKGYYISTTCNVNSCLNPGHFRIGHDHPNRNRRD